MNNYFELKISINPEIEDIVSDICFSNFACEGVVLAEEDWKDLEMTATTRGTLKVFLTEITFLSHIIIPPRKTFQAFLSAFQLLPLQDRR